MTGTDTDVGKSVLAAALCAALAATGERVAAFKPAFTGLDGPSEDWPPDHELLAAAAGAGQSPAEVAPHRFGPPLSPHLAAELCGTRIDPGELLASARRAAAGADALICEGVGGLMVPLDAKHSVQDLARWLRLPAVVVARPGLGTINHTLLTVEAARAVGLQVAAVVMTPWPESPSPAQVSNRQTIERAAEVPVTALPFARRDTLAQVGARLPFERWLGPRPFDGGGDASRTKTLIRRASAAAGRPG